MFASKIIPPIDRTHWVGICQNEISYPIRQMIKYTLARARTFTARGTAMVYKQRHPYTRWNARGGNMLCQRVSDKLLFARRFPRCACVCAFNEMPYIKLAHTILSIHARCECLGGASLMYSLCVRSTFLCTHTHVSGQLAMS